MNSQTDFTFPEPNRNSISKDLDQMIDLVCNLCKLSRRIGLQALSALVQPIKPRSHILELRRNHTDFMDTVGAIKSLERHCRAEADQAMRQRLDGLFSEPQLDVLDAFSVSVREICALLPGQLINLQATVTETVRFIESELEQVLTEMRAVLKVRCTSLICWTGTWPLPMN